LGHRSLSTTQVYAKVDLVGLRTVATFDWEACYEAAPPDQTVCHAQAVAGFRFRTEQRILKGFDQAMGGITWASPSVAVRTYLDGRGPVTLYWLRKWGPCADFIGLRWPGHGSPMSLAVACAQSGRPLHPYIYSQSELRRLLQAITPERTNGVSPQTVRTLLLLLYARGCA